MILVCPLCQTRYLVPANLFAAGSRPVRCARCKHGWEAELPKEMEVVTPYAPAPEKTAPIPKGSNLPALPPTPLGLLWKKSRWWFLGFLVVVALLWLIFDRQQIGRRWTFLEPLYNAVNLSIYYPGEELEFDEVRSVLKFEGGITKLILDGKVRNKTKKSQKVPNIVAQALGPDARVIQSWQIDSPKATLAPGEEVPFSSSMNAPKGTIVNVNLNFTETTDDK